MGRAATKTKTGRNAALSKEGINMQTITVQNWNGEIQVNREEFVQRWMDQVNGIWTLCYTSEDHEKAQRIKNDLKSLADNAFDLLLEEEERGENES